MNQKTKEKKTEGERGGKSGKTERTRKKTGERERRTGCAELDGVNVGCNLSTPYPR